MTPYFPRRLRFTDDKDQTWHVDEHGMLSISGPKILLGEPGMGKSELIQEIGRRCALTPITAVRFMLSKNPERLLEQGKPLLIDGLDEAIARRDGDAVDQVLAQLDKVGSPDFILSCRAREWQARTVSNLRQLYGFEPIIFSIEPLTPGEARLFLAQRYPNADADHIIEHLNTHHLTELYCNPLTLGLLGRVAEHDVHLPATRATLFQRVCEIIWPEHDPDRQDIGLGPISEDQALDGAGAISAALLFGGAEAASLAAQAQLQEGDLRLVELEALPHAGKARAVFSSKLFYGVGAGRAKPIHRVIAEYLGARWLARHATSPRAQRRLLTQFHGGGGVPSSLRGLHAWLAFHSPAMAESVITADPYGVLRYGETSILTTPQASRLLEALQALATRDPYFRSADWDRPTALGLMVPTIRDKIDATIRAQASNGQLRSLLLEAMTSTPLAAELSSTLELVIFSIERTFHERSVAAEALVIHHDRAWWRQAVTNLCTQCTEDSIRLARSVIEMIDCDVDDLSLVGTLYAEMGVTIRPLPRDKERGRHTLRSYSRVLQQIPVGRLTSVLDLIVDFAALVDRTQRRIWADLAEIVERLVLRAVEEKAIGSAEAPALWRWLFVLQEAGAPHGVGAKLKARLQKEDVLRRAVQLHALYDVRHQPTILQEEIYLQRRLVSLRTKSDDIIRLLDRLAEADNRDKTLREDWRDLMMLAVGPTGFDSAVRAASRRFQRNDAQLETFVKKLENPKMSAWEVRQKREHAKREKKRRIAFETQRRPFQANRTRLRAGELDFVLNPARAYLGHFSDLNKDQPPADRIAEWLGADLRDDTLVGFDAVLHRNDLPSSEQVAQGFAKDETWNYSYAIMAALLARHRAGESLADIAPDILLTGLLLCYNDRWMTDDKDLADLQEALELLVIPTPKDREKFIRLWVEPSLQAGRKPVLGLYMLAHDKEWQSNGSLAGEWLAAYPQAPASVELEMVDCLTHSGSLGKLAVIAAARSTQVFHDFEHMLAWLAIDVLVRFDTVLPEIIGIGANNPEFIWFLRNRFQLERRGAMLNVDIAQAKWIISEFRGAWPYAVLQGTGTGDTNPYDATDFLRSILGRIVDNSSIQASDALQALIVEPEDSYTDLIRHMAAEQLQKKVEESFSPLTPRDLGDLLADGPPSNVDDLKSLVREEIAVAQKKLIGDDIDQVRDFWSDDGIPYNENRCRDRLTAIIGPELARYGVQRITEADMPQTKRADLAFAFGQLQLPMEIKGQWHPDVWDAATDQLDAQYLIDWRSEQRGIYCVLWFGDLPALTGRRLRAPPTGAETPTTAEEMKKMLVDRIPESRRALIDVVVLDLTAGRL